MATWSLPFDTIYTQNKSFSVTLTFFKNEASTTIGRIQGLAKVIVNEVIMTGWKSRIFGYISSGERVPEVMTTVWKRLKTGLMAIDESKQL
jgi:hypothetical protein